MSFLEKAAHMLWRAWLVVGCLGLLFGIVAVAWPDGTITTITMIFAVLLLIGSLLVGYVSWRVRSTIPFWWLIIPFLVITIIIAIWGIANPSSATIVLGVFIGITAIVAGIGNVMTGAATAVAGIGWPVILSGILQVIIGIMLCAIPFTSLSTITWVLGIMAIVMSISMLVTGFTIRHTLKSDGVDVSLLS